MLATRTRFSTFPEPESLSTYSQSTVGGFADLDRQLDRIDTILAMNEEDADSPTSARSWFSFSSALSDARLTQVFAGDAYRILHRHYGDLVSAQNVLHIPLNVEAVTAWSNVRYRVLPLTHWVMSFSQMATTPMGEAVQNPSTPNPFSQLMDALNDLQRWLGASAGQ